MLLRVALFHSFLGLDNIPSCMYHIFSIHSSVWGHLGCFHDLAIVSSTTVNTGVYVCAVLSISAD